jgi:hypothetical protein
MKTKNIVVAIFAFVFAIGGAFASMRAPETVYVWARRTVGATPVCVQTNKACNQTTDHSKLCRIEISVTKPGVGTQVATSTGTFVTYESGCEVVLYDVSDVLQTGAAPIVGTIYELVIQ